jgi:murein DD-endopeptidase MepM/ murein hydrolase activator NlpD
MIIFFLCSCFTSVPVSSPPKESLPTYLDLFQENPNYKSDGFDFPVGKPNAQNYVNKGEFGEITPSFNNKKHLGEDWNGTEGGNSDLGDPIYAISNGMVSHVQNHGGGWCNVMRIVHYVDGQIIESLYAHNQEMWKEQGEWVKRGEQIATIGICNERWAHLHLELRDTPDQPLAGGYADNTTGYMHPTNFINSHRP